MKSVADKQLETKGAAARKAARTLAQTSSHVRDNALITIANTLELRQDEVLTANLKDRDAGQRKGLSNAVLGRLMLDSKSIHGMAADVRAVAVMKDPINETFDVSKLPSGLQVGKRRVPLGVIGVIYESRPNVTIDISSLCLKSGNAVILRGGKEAIHSNTVLVNLIRDAIKNTEIPHGAVQFIESSDRELVGQMLKMSDAIDLIIPRGSAELVRRVRDESTIPAVTGGVGVCHIYVDKYADVDMAVAIADNSKISRPYACNALDTLLVHSSIAPIYLPQLATIWAKSGIEMRCDRRALSLIGNIGNLNATPIKNDEWGEEFLSLIAAIKIVDSMDEALLHIETHGSGHTEAIVTNEYANAMRFLDEIDSGVVLVNASTVFNDGGQLGLGAEVAISTNKMHARGPMGLKELTSYKWTVLGTGQVRN